MQTFAVPRHNKICRKAVEAKLNCIADNESCSKCSLTAFWKIAITFLLKLIHINKAI